MKDEEGDLPIIDLSLTAKSVIEQLDGIATEIAYRSYLSILRKIKAQQGIDYPPPEKKKVFISYREPHLILAKKIHSILYNYGNCSHFDPFLDEHNVSLGEWKKQLFDNLKESQVFVPLVTNDYAPPGSISREELDEAYRMYKENRLQIAPIIFRGVNTEVSEKLRKFHALIIENERELNDKNAKTHQFCRVILTSIMKNNK